MMEGVKALLHHHQVQEWKKKYTKKTTCKTHMCQKCTSVLGKTELVYKPPINMDKEESESSNNDKQNKTNLQKKRSSCRTSKNNDGRSKDTAVLSSAVPTVKCADGGNVSDIGEDYKKPFFISDERKIWPTG
eukprot:1008539-Ditylum_brightwellii.AAC.1